MAIAMTAAQEATVASSVLRRPLLAGIDCEWVDGARRRQHDAHYRCTTTLATAWNALGDHQLATTIAESAVQLDPLREIGHRLVIESELARGDRGAALRAYARCEAVLASELGVGPSAETEALGERIRAPEAGAQRRGHAGGAEAAGVN